MYGHRSSRLRFGVDLDRIPSFLFLYVAQKSLDHVRSSNLFLTAVSEDSRSFTLLQSGGPPSLLLHCSLLL